MIFQVVTDRARKLTAVPHLILLSVASIYVVLWTSANLGLFVDPLLQNDDARTVLFPFLSYEGIEAFDNDQLSREMLAFMPPAALALYAGLAKAIGIYAATKVIQGICIGIVMFAVFIAWRARKHAGPAWAVILFFMFLHNENVWLKGMGGGLPRAFAFPWMMLWAAGIVSQSRNTRGIAIVGAALTYPSSMLILLGAEGINSVTRLWATFDGRQLAYHAKWLSILTVLCLVVVSPMLIGDREAGPIHSLEQAQLDPAFSEEGRLKVLPFPPVVRETMKSVVEPLKPRNGMIWPGIAFEYWSPTAAVRLGFALFAVSAVLILFRRVPWPSASFAIGLSSMCLYLLARWFAFLLYSPERFLSYGMTAAVIIYLADIFGRVASDRGLARAHSERVNTISAVAVITFVIFLSGDGITPNRNGATINGREQDKLYTFLKTLPEQSTLVAAHPIDGDNVPWWGQRRVLISYETLQPWFRDGWARQKRITFDLLRGMYATSCKPLQNLVYDYDVSHILVNLDRFKTDFKERAELFEPFDSWLSTLIADADKEDFVIPTLLQHATVFQYGNMVLLDAPQASMNCSIDALDNSEANKSQPAVDIS